MEKKNPKKVQKPKITEAELKKRREEMQNQPISFKITPAKKKK